MKRIFKRTFAALIAATTMAVTGSYTVLNTSAAGRLTTNADQGQNSFSEKWSAVWTFECGDTYTGSMTIGFDTWWTDEDFVKFFGTKTAIIMQVLRTALIQLSIQILKLEALLLGKLM